RLSTAIDSVTLYGEDPDQRPDIYGKIGNSGVSVATLDDCKKLYSGFDLCGPSTSVSMTINGPAPMLLGFFMNTAIDQQCEKYILENGLKAETEKKIRQIYEEKALPPPSYNSPLPQGHDGLGLLLLGVTGDEVLPAGIYEKIKARTLSSVRGTVQADILKEDQAQNTCIFSTEFALRMMGDIQEYFSRHQVKNFYSVSISGYHIAEAGANPVTQLAFTLANGFTFVEYYLSRGMHIDDFAPNLSFFFSNGIDPEYSVIGRVARRIWAKAMRYKYKGNDRSQKLKYHIQTSGRSLHAQEIDFNDIRTTLQALYAIYDNCNSLHTNAYDEAITTPTEESVRRAMAIQLIINRELGLAKNENPLQGAFIIEKLTDMVENAVYAEFRRLSERGGVLGAMETMYQRGKIQEESLYYEALKHNGDYPIIGVNTFLSSRGSPTVLPREVIRALEPEKQFQISSLSAFRERNRTAAPAKLEALKRSALQNRNTFETLLEACKVCSLGQLSQALYEVGGQYRRNM
ncbi:MAG TPA: methylmalonyl-CoA mutase family protein, partial [Anseongella sp.]|nr:methylmalonyl-CoA mutase family protein [Anseongella sp.]